MPSRRSLGIGVAILAVAGGVYAAARESSVFAVRSIDVSGAPPRLQAQVRAALASFDGASLLALDGPPSSDGSRRCRRCSPSATTAPSRTRFTSSSSREAGGGAPPRHRELARVGAREGDRQGAARKRARPAADLGADAAAVLAGAFLDATHGGTAARSLALVAGRFPARIAAASFTRGNLVFRLRSGLELELGDPTDVRLKLAIARRALFALPPGATYLDVSVPRRPVAGTNPQVSSGG